jgi:hypothetical protein
MITISSDDIKPTIKDNIISLDGVGPMIDCNTISFDDIRSIIDDIFPLYDITPVVNDNII